MIVSSSGLEILPLPEYTYTLNRILNYKDRNLDPPTVMDIASNLRFIVYIYKLREKKTAELIGGLKIVTAVISCRAC